MFSETRKGCRQLLEDFIKCYQSEPCLWNTKVKEYHDKGRKHAAYAKLLRIYRLLEPRADRITVVKKINILRTNHRKEKKKVEESKRSGNNSIYAPRLWYYQLFDFLEDQKNRSTTSYKENEKYDGAADQQIEVYVDETSVSQDSQSSNLTTHDFHSPGIQLEKDTSHMQNLQSPQLTSLDLQIPPKRSPPDGDEDFNYREQENNPKKPKWGDDRYQLLATNVTLKMKDIQNDTQRLLAEKMINEALFLAEMGQLSMSHSIGLTQTYYSPHSTVYNVGRSELSYHNSSNTRAPTSTFAAKNIISITSPDCTSQYENEEQQSFNCNCSQTNRSIIEENEDFKDPLLSKDLT